MNNLCVKIILNFVWFYYRFILDYYKVVVDRLSYINCIFSILLSYYFICVYIMWGGEVGGEGGMECFFFYFSWCYIIYEMECLLLVN